jgi:hypothetical protein
MYKIKKVLRTGYACPFVSSYECLKRRFFKIIDKRDFFTCYSGGGVQLGPLGTAATNKPIVPAPADYDD